MIYDFLPSLIPLDHPIFVETEEKKGVNVFDNSWKCSSVKNGQEDSGKYAVIALLEYYLKNVKNVDIVLSEKSIKSTEMYSMMLEIQKEGIEGYKIEEFYVVDNPTISKLKSILSSGSVFIGGFTCYKGFGVESMVNMPNSEIIGGHAVLFTGFDDEKRVLKFKNSMGESWGDAGYGYLPYHYVESGDLMDVMTIMTPTFSVNPATRIVVLRSRLGTMMQQVGDYTDLSTILSTINDADNSQLYPSDVTALNDLAVQQVNQRTISTNLLHIIPP